MQSVISDCLIQDPLNGALPVYPFDEGKTYYFIDSDLKPTLNVSRDKVFIPLIQYEGDWHSSYREEPKVIKETLEKLLLKAAILSKHTIKTNSYFNGLKLSAQLIGLLTDVPGSSYAFSYGDLRVLCSKEFKLKHIEELSSIFLERRFVPVDGLKDNKLIALPYPEFVGCLPFDGQTFGAFAFPEYIVNVEF